MATTSHPHTPPRQPKRKRDAAPTNFGPGSDDENSHTPPGARRKVRPGTPPLAKQSPNTRTAAVYVGTARDLEQSEEEEEEEEERQRSDQRVSTSRGGRMSSPPPPRYMEHEDDEQGCKRTGGGQRKHSWTEKLRKPIEVDTGLEKRLGYHLSDLETGLATQYDHQDIYRELNELNAEYAEAKSGRPLPERSLFTLTGKAGLTTEQRLSVGDAKSKPELGRLLRHIEASAPTDLKIEVFQVRVMPRSGGIGMPAHRDSIDMSLDRFVYTIHTAPTTNPPNFFCRLLAALDAKPDRGPYEEEVQNITKDHGRVVVQGPSSRGENTRVVHGVTGGDGGSITGVVDFRTSRVDGGPSTQEDRDTARRSVLALATRTPYLPGGVAVTYADTFVFPMDAPRTTGSRRATEANNAMVPDGNGGMEKRATQKGENAIKKRKEDMDTFTDDCSRGGAASSGVDCNQVGAGKNSNNAARLRQDIPGATKARGLCLGLDAKGDGLAEKLATWIDTDTGAIREGAPLCGRPKFGKDGYLTRGEGEWKQDGKGYLVLGVHNSHGKPTNPWCGIGGTVPVVLVGGKRRVAEWALPFIKASKVVQRNTDNQRHGRVPKKAKT
ncbi:unnamed protein product [Pylaiella littoralis]